MPENIVQNLIVPAINSLRGPYSVREAVEIVALFLMLKHLVDSGAINSNFFTRDDAQFADLIELIEQAKALPIIKESFKELMLTPDVVLREILAIMRGLPDLSAEDIVNLLTLDASNSRMGIAYFPITLMQFLVKLVGVRQTDSVYCASPMTLPMAALLLENAGKVAYENVVNEKIASLLAVMFADKLTVAFSEPLMNPKFVSDAGDRLQRFDYGFSFSPFSYKFQQDYQKNDKFSRFELVTRNYEVAIIEHLIVQIDKLVCVTINANLLATEIDKSFRQFLINKGLLKAVIYLPQGVQSVATAFLLIDPKGGSKSVRFVNLEQVEYLKKEGRNYVLNEIDTLVNQVNSDDEYPGIVSVTYNNIIAADYVLTVQKHVLSNEGKQLATLLSSRETKTLNQLVNFERPLPPKITNGDVIVCEIGAADAQYGYIQNPEKTISISDQALNDYETNFLVPKDIVLIVKGSTGKVGIVPEDVPVSGEGGWVAGQSAMILRMKKNAEISAETLFVYLRSQAGQELLRQMNSGSVISNLSLKDLKQMPVIIPSKEEMAEAEKNLAKDREVGEQIAALQAELATLREQVWRLS